LKVSCRLDKARWLHAIGLACTRIARALEWHGTYSKMQKESAYQGDSVHKQVWQQLGIDLPLRADVAVTTNLGKHVVLALTMTGEPDLAHPCHPSLADLHVTHNAA